MNTTSLVLVLPVLAASLLAQDAGAVVPKRSLADGIVRHRIESERIAAPHIEAGLEIGQGKGPMLLLVRSKDGEWSGTELERGPGDHGEVPTIAKIELGALEEAMAPANGVPVPTKATAATDPPKLGVERLGDALTIIGAGIELAGKDADREHLRPLLKELFAKQKDTRWGDQLQLRCGKGVAVQDVLLVWDTAYEVGYRTPLIEDGDVGGRPAAALEELIAGMPKTFAWTGRRLEKLPMPLYDAELLLLVDGSLPFTEVAAVMRACARVGIWQIGLAGQKDAKVRFKLPINLPTHD